MTSASSDRTAAEIAGSWPEEVSAAALVAHAAGGRLPAAALELMESLAGRRRPAILVSVDPEAELPEEEAAAAGAPGLSGVIRGEVSLKEAARARAGRPYAFIGAGSGEDSASLLASPELERLARGIRAAGGILLVHVPPDLAGPLPTWMDGRVVAGRVKGAGSFGASLNVLGRLGETVEEGRGRAEEAGGDRRDTGSGRWRRHRKERRVPWGRIGAAAAGVLVLAAGWWFLAREAVDPADGAGAGTADSVAAARDGGSDPVPGRDSAPGAEAATEGTGPASAEGAGAPGSGRDSPTGSLAGSELPYSVLVASFGRARDAEGRVERLRQSVPVPVFAAPTTVGGSLYHRVFAGARADTSAAGALMRELADRGLKRSTSSWDLRPARWALLLSRHPSEEEARKARRALGSAAVYTYVLRDGEAGDASYQLYAGGFEARSAARELEQILQEAGHEPELLIRRGEPR